MVGKTVWDEPRTKTLDEICADMSSGASDVGAEYALGYINGLRDCGALGEEEACLWRSRASAAYFEHRPDGGRVRLALMREKTVFLPELMASAYDGDGAEVECCEAAPGNLAYACAECGCTLAGGEDGWFDEKRGDHGGIAYRPRFNFCPECGRMVERRWQPQPK